MGLFEGLADIFINVFGITQPTDAMRRKTAWFILGMMALVIAGLFAIGILLYHLINAK